MLLFWLLFCLLGQLGLDGRTSANESNEMNPIKTDDLRAGFVRQHGGLSRRALSGRQDNGCVPSGGARTAMARALELAQATGCRWAQRSSQLVGAGR